MTDCLMNRGFVPYGFTQKTRRGKTIYRKVEALYWSCERSIDRAERHIEIHLRLWKILEAFKKALAEEMENVIDAPDKDRRNS